MTDLQRELVNAGIIVAVYLLIFSVGEILRRLVPSRPEVIRKSVHLSGALVALSFPYLLKSHWTALVLAIVFIAVLTLARKKGVLKSIYSVERESHGGIYFPIAFYLVFLLAHNRPILYFIPILVLAVSDAVAALVGVKYGSIKLEIEGHTKSLEGSISFFFVTFLCVHLPLLLWTSMDKLQSVLIAFVIALMVTAFELISIRGQDNILVPLGTYFILAKMTNYPLPETIRLIQILFFVIAVTLVVFWRVRSTGWSGRIGMILLNYAAWTLLGFRWFLPLLLGEIVFALLVSCYRRVARGDVPGYHIRAVFYTAIVPTILIFITNELDNQRVMYLPYLTAAACQMTLMGSFLVLHALEGRQKMNLKTDAAVGFVSSILSVILVVLLPVLIYGEHSTPVSVAVAWVTTFLAYWLNCGMHRLLGKKRLRRFEDFGRFRIRLVSTSFSVIVALAAQTVLLR